MGAKLKRECVCNEIIIELCVCTSSICKWREKGGGREKKEEIVQETTGNEKQKQRIKHGGINITKLF